MKQMKRMKHMDGKTLGGLAAAAAMLIGAAAQAFGAKPKPAPRHEGVPPEAIATHDARMKWWRDAKFGMFINYGLHSGLGGTIFGKKYGGGVEWIQKYSGTDSETYAKEAAPKFNPKPGKAAEWVRLAKESGCRYIVFSARHHEGFNMFDTKHTDFNVKALKGIDVSREYVDACRKNGIKAGFYFSVIDWHHPDYDPTGSYLPYPSGNYAMVKQGKRRFGSHGKYKKYLYAIFDDLLTGYHPDIVWWDYSHFRFEGDRAWGATRLMKDLFDKCPDAIQNNRLYAAHTVRGSGALQTCPLWKGDFTTPEHYVPESGVPGDWEVCQTLNGTWGYSAHNHNWKKPELLIRELVDTVSRGGNYLLNIGPMADGTVPPDSVRIFRAIGAWMKVNGEAVYGTQANPTGKKLPWGRMTCKGCDATYLFVYGRPAGGELSVPCLFAEDARAAWLDGGAPVKMTRRGGGTIFSIAEDARIDPAASVIKVAGRRLPPPPAPAP